MKKVEHIERTKNSFVDFKTSVSRMTESKEPLLKNSLEPRNYIEKRGGFCFNMRQIWNYTPSN